jgi:hypothetical protein
MKFDVAGCISQLLYEHDAVIIPDFGALVSAYKPASIDYVQGVIHPPSKQLSFNDQMAANDGLLYTALQQTYQLSLSEAQQAVDDFVRDARQKLEEREIIIFPRVGRVYHDFESNLQFLQDTTNFNRDVFGLPRLQFYPILRSRDGEEAGSRPTAPAVAATKPSLLERRWIPMLIPILFALAIGIVGLSIFMTQQRGQMIDEVQRLPAEYPMPVNKNPKTADLQSEEVGKGKETTRNSIMPGFDEEAETTAEDSPAKLEEVAVEVPLDTEEPSLAPNQHECVIIIGQFQEKAGVSRRVNEIYEIGFNAYTAVNDRNGLTMVGVRFIYEDPKDVTKALRYLRRRFESAAWVLRPASFKG